MQTSPIEPNLKDTVDGLRFYQRCPFKALAGFGLAASLFLVVTGGALGLEGIHGVDMASPSGPLVSPDHARTRVALNSNPNQTNPLPTREPQQNFVPLHRVSSGNWKRTLAVSILVIVLVAITVGLAVYLEQLRMPEEVDEEAVVASAKEAEPQKQSDQQEPPKEVPGTGWKIGTGIVMLYAVNMVYFVLSFHFSGNRPTLNSEVILHIIMSIFLLQPIFTLAQFFFCALNALSVLCKKYVDLKSAKGVLLATTIITTRLLSMIFGFFVFPYVLYFSFLRVVPEFVDNWKRLWFVPLLEATMKTSQCKFG